MSQVRCSCKESECRTYLNPENDGLFVHVEHGDQKCSHFVYLDANTLVELIKELQKSLIERTKLDA